MKFSKHTSLCCINCTKKSISKTSKKKNYQNVGAQEFLNSFTALVGTKKKYKGL